MIKILAQTVHIPDAMAPWAQLTGTAAIIMLFVWLVTKGMPAMLERHDKIQSETTSRFEAIIDKIDKRRESSEKEGHDAARYLGDAIAKQGVTLTENTEALRMLMSHVQLRRDNAEGK